MKIVCAGYREWAFRIFDRLIKDQKGKKWKVGAVITTKGQEVPFKKLGVRTAVFEPADFRSGKLRDLIAREKCACVLFYGWSWLVPKDVLDLSLSVALHPSPLPRYRGGSPIQNQILAGEKESAVSLFVMTEKLDDGDILARKKIPLSGDLSDILDRIVESGGTMTSKMLDQLCKGKLKRMPQDHSKATVCRRRKPEDSEITMEELKGRPARYIYDKIRALQDPYPNAFIRCGDGKKVFLTRAKIEK